MADVVHSCQTHGSRDITEEDGTLALDIEGACLLCIRRTRGEEQGRVGVSVGASDEEVIVEILSGEDVSVCALR